MSEPSATPQFPSSPTGSADGTSAGPATPKSLLEQMQELLASVSADLAELQSTSPRGADSAAYPTGTDTSDTSGSPESSEEPDVR
ncbi:hypothetical protein [Kitasatospora brasiliensis]|uniref:hypothetical protein n=1 Tax=Kitasatospora brasiliensis TaxID=3058040 RepID=UPI002930F616|nr:hypothetical protein [Kitasatospora sp. K002]